MKKHGTAAAPDHGAEVVIEHDHDVVEMVFAPQVFVAGRKRQPYRPIVARMIGVVAPAHVSGKWHDREKGCGGRHAIRPKKDFLECEMADGRRPVPLALARLRPRSSQRACKCSIPETENALVPMAGSGPDGQGESGQILEEH